jgi:pSer/pThr/pTyr-binding forkhead associated (FHA) protein
VANTLVCGECGTFLPAGDPEGAGAPGNGGASWDGVSGDRTAAVARSATTPPPRLRLLIGDAQHAAEVTLNKAVSLGRSDPAAKSIPEIDLTAYGGLEKGVSRRHARISARRNTVVVEDLASINGTFVNGRRLIPYLAEVLRDGDQLQIGNISIEVEFL